MGLWPRGESTLEPAHPIKLITQKKADKRVLNDYLVRANRLVQDLRLNRDLKMAADTTKSAGDAAGLADLISRAAEQAGSSGRGLPPVERWNPPFCGDIDMEIRSDGTWFYMGTPIGRAPLVRLFSTVLRKDEDGKTYLVTPVEKVGIRVADAPFLAVEMQSVEGETGPALSFRTNVGDVVEAGPEHPLRFEIVGENRELKPYLLVRGRLEALVSRAVMYELAALGEVVDVDGTETFAVQSGGAIFPIMPAAELDHLSK
jgi:hypothetical protein